MNLIAIKQAWSISVILVFGASLWANLAGATPNIQEDIKNLQIQSVSGFAMDLETTYGTTDLKYDDEDILVNTFKLKPKAIFDTSSMRFQASVPLTWVESESKNKVDGSRESDEVRIVGRPEVGAHLKLYNGLILLGGGVRLPMFSSSGGNSETYRYAGLYASVDVRSDWTDGWQFIGDTKLLKDLDKNESRDFVIKSKTKRGAIFHGRYGAQKMWGSKMSIGSTIKLLYGLSDTQSEYSFVGYNDKLETGSNSFGTVKRSSFEVFTDVILNNSSKLVARVEKVLQTNSESEFANMLNTLGEFDQNADVLVSINYTYGF